MTTLDTNSVSAEAASTSISTYTALGIFVTDLTGAHNNHVITLYLSPDGVIWQATEHQIIGTGYVHVPICGSNAKLVVTTAEGATSTCDVFINKC